MRAEAFQTVESSMWTRWNLAKGCGQEWEKGQSAERCILGLASGTPLMSRRQEEGELGTGETRRGASVRAVTCRVDTGSVTP